MLEIMFEIIMLEYNFVYFLEVYMSFVICNSRNCDEIRREGGLKALCYLLIKVVHYFNFPFIYLFISTIY